MYTHIIGIDIDLWNILEDDIDILVNGVGVVIDKKTVTPAQRKTYRKHHRVRGILVNALPHSEYIVNLLLKPFLYPYMLHIKGINK